MTGSIFTDFDAATAEPADFREAPKVPAAHPPSWHESFASLCKIQLASFERMQGGKGSSWYGPDQSPFLDKLHHPHTDPYGRPYDDVDSVDGSLGGSTLGSQLHAPPLKALEEDLVALRHSLRLVHDAVAELQQKFVELEELKVAKEKNQ